MAFAVVLYVYVVHATTAGRIFQGSPRDMIALGPPLVAIVRVDSAR